MLIINQSFVATKNPYIFLFKGHSLPCEPCSSDSEAQNYLKVTAFLWMMHPGNSGKFAMPMNVELENYQYLFSAEKLQLHIARCPPSTKKWNHRWAGVPSKKKLSDTKIEARVFSLCRGAEPQYGAVLQRLVCKARWFARRHSAPSLWNTNKTVETLLLSLGSWGPDQPWGLHHRLPQSFSAGRRGGHVEPQPAAVQEQLLLARPLLRTGSKQDVLQSKWFKWHLRCPRLSLLLIPIFSCREPMQTEHFGNTFKQIFKWCQNLAIHRDACKWRLRWCGGLKVWRGYSI